MAHFGFKTCMFAMTALVTAGLMVPHQPIPTPQERANREAGSRIHTEPLAELVRQSPDPDFFGSRVPLARSPDVLPVPDPDGTLCEHRDEAGNHSLSCPQCALEEAAHGCCPGDAADDHTCVKNSKTAASEKEAPRD